MTINDFMTVPLTAAPWLLADLAQGMREHKSAEADEEDEAELARAGLCRSCGEEPPFCEVCNPNYWADLRDDTITRESHS